VDSVSGYFLKMNSPEEKKNSKIEEQLNSTKVFTTYHSSLDCYSQKYTDKNIDQTYSSILA